MTHLFCYQPGKKSHINHFLLNINPLTDRDLRPAGDALAHVGGVLEGVGLPAVPGHAVTEPGLGGRGGHRDALQRVHAVV